MKKGKVRKLFRMWLYYIPNISKFITQLLTNWCGCVVYKCLCTLLIRRPQNMTAGWLMLLGFLTIVAIVEEITCQINKKMLAKHGFIPQHQNVQDRASLMAQWLRICLPVQGTRVRALVWEDPTCRGATRPVSHNY